MTIRSGPLTFGQQGYFLYHHLDEKGCRHRWNLRWEWQVPADVGLTAVENVIRTLVGRHEALRTTYSYDQNGTPTQYVQPLEDVPSVLLVSDENNALGTSSGPEFDLSSAPPVRFDIVVMGDIVCKIVCTAHHVAVDSWSVAVLSAEFQSLLAAVAGESDLPVLPSVTRQPVDIAVEQRRPSAVSRSTNALDYWKEVVGTTPCALEHRSRSRPRTHFVATLTTGAALHAIRLLEERLNLPASAVVLAAFGMQASRYIRRTRFVVLSPCANRFRPSEESLVTCLHQVSAIRLDTSGRPPLAELVSQAARAAMVAGLNASYDCFQWYRLLATHGYRDRFRIDNWLAYNYLSHEIPRGSADSTDLREWEYRELTADDPKPFLGLYLLVTSRKGGLRLTLSSNSQILRSDDAKSFLASIEDLLERTAKESA